MAKRVYYGGQAVIEGVMMRGQKTMVIAVRHPDGELVTETQPLPTIYTGWMRKTPLIRGIIVLVETLALGVKALLYSANVSLEEEEVAGGLMWGITAMALVLAIALFFIVPLFLTRLLNINSSLLFNLTDSLIRVTIFIAYLKALTLVPDLKRVFAYHGAEHKAVNTYENGAPLEVATAQRYSTAHMRCGTSFLFVVLILSTIVFALSGLHMPWLMVLWRIALIPVIAALGYEIIYLGAKYTNNRLVRITLSPGLWLQALTTREPDENQLEVALVALRKVIEADQSAARTQDQS